MDDYKTVYETGKFGLNFHILLTCIVFIVLYNIIKNTNKKAEVTPA